MSWEAGLFEESDGGGANFTALYESYRVAFAAADEAPAPAPRRTPPPSPRRDPDAAASAIAAAYSPERLPASPLPSCIQCPPRSRYG